MGVYIVRFIYNFKNQFEKYKIKRKFKINGFKGKFISIEHHYAHAGSAYYTQEKDKGLAITIDGGGEGYCSHVYKAENNKLNLVHKITSYHSLAFFYAYITKLLGFTPLRHEGKILGLSAAGNPTEVEQILKKYIKFNKHNLKFENTSGYYLKVYKKLEKNLKNFSREDIAAGIQVHTENLTLEYIRAIIEKFSPNQKTNLFMAGGIFANIKINQKIAELDEVKSCFVFPNMGDGGLSAGGALGAYFQDNLNEIKKKHNMYLGSSSNQKFKNTLINSKFSIINPENKFKFIVSKLNENKIIGIFQKKWNMALGHLEIDQ